MAEIDISIDQLNIVYSDGLPNYRLGVTNYSDGSTNAAKAVNLFNSPYLDHYLTNAVEMAMRIMEFTSDSSLLLTGYEAFSFKIASLIKYLEETNDYLSLDDYPDLKECFDVLSEINLDLSDLDAVDSKALDKYKDYLNKYETIINAKKELFEKMKGQKSITKSQFTKELKEAGYTDEEIERIISTYHSMFEGKTLKLLPAVTAAVITLTAFGQGYASASTAGSLLGDDFFFWNDTPAWLLNTPLSKTYELMANAFVENGSLFGGVAAALTVGTILAFKDGDFDTETFLEQGVSAATGSVAGSLAVGALGLTGGLAILAGVAVSVGVTVGVSKLFSSIFNMPGGVPNTFDEWSEEERIKYIEKQTGIDLGKINDLNKMMSEGTYSDDEIEKIIKYIGHEKIVLDADYKDSCIIAFDIYCRYRDMIEYNGIDSEDVRHAIEYELGRYLAIAEIRDEVYEYIERFIATL